MTPEAHSEPYWISEMECFAKMVNAKKLLTIFVKCSILMKLRQDNKYTSGY